jgi:SAM-dependent methyltransferase
LTVALTDLPERLVAALRLRARALAHRGDAVQCPICGHRFSVLRDDWNRVNALCWRCGSHERHRALWLYLQRHPQLLGDAGSLLHFAPEWCLQQRLQRVPGLRYVTTDLDPGKGELELDITALALADASFGAIICSHVLEHVPDDAAAMRELHRVLRPGGWAIVMVPLDTGRASTYEDPAVVTPGQRELAYWQDDHVRLYAPDIVGRLSAAGFTVSIERVAAQLGPELARRHRLLEADYVFLCRRPPSAVRRPPSAGPPTDVT